MRKLTYLVGFCLIFVISILSGCTDKLGVVDFSGVVDLKASKEGWAYRTVDKTDFSRANLSPDTRLSEFRDRLELSKIVQVGANEYYLVTRTGVSNGFSIRNRYVKIEFNQGFKTHIYDLETHQLIKPFVIKDMDTGDSWSSQLDEFRSSEIKNTLDREGRYDVVFYEPSIDADCIVSGTYSIKSKVERKVDQDGNFILVNDGYEYREISVKGSAELKIGLRQCLAGEMTVMDKLIKFYVLDWNLDGQFTEDDIVWCDYIEEYLPFGKTIRLTNSFLSSKDNKYVLSLKTPTRRRDTYQLQIDLVATGKQ